MLVLVWNVIFLIFCTVEDVKNKQIYVIPCVINIILGCLAHVIAEDMGGIQWLAGALIGATFFILSVVTKDKIGKGDALMIAAIGVISGGKNCFEIVMWSFVICTAFSLIAIAVGKLNRKSVLPLAPFLLSGALIILISQAV